MRSFDSPPAGGSFRMKIGIRANFHFITFFIIVNILLIITQTPMIMRYVNTPPNRYYPFVHTDWAHDYYLYLAAINQGISGDFLYHDPYTTEPTNKGIFYIFFTMTGQIARIFRFNPILTYHLLTLISFEMFVISIYLLSRTIFNTSTQPKIPFLKTRVPCKDDRLSKGVDTWPMRNKTYDKGEESEKHGIEDATGTTFWASLFAIFGTISPTLVWNLNIDFPLNMPWWIMMDAFERLYALPHYNFSQALLLVSIILFIKFIRTKKLKYAFFSSLTIFIAGLILPSVLIPVVTILPASYFLFLLINYFQTKQFSFYLKIARGIIAAVIAALTVYVIMKWQVQTGFPWNQWTKWGLNRWNFGEPYFDKTFLLSFGILPILSLPAIWEGLKKNNWVLIFTSLWAVVPFILLPFATPLEIAKIRLAEVANFVPFGILAAYTIFKIIPKIIHLTNTFNLSTGGAREGLPARAADRQLAVEHEMGEPSDRTRKLQFLAVILFFASALPASLNILNQRIRYTQTEPIFDHIYIPKTSFEAIEFIGKNVPKDSKILSHEKYGIIIPAFTPAISYFGHVTQTMNYFEKEKNVKDFFSGSWKEPEAKEFLTRNGINYVYYGWQERELGNAVTKYSFLKPVFQNKEVTVFKTNL